MPTQAMPIPSNLLKARRQGTFQGRAGLAHGLFSRSTTLDTRISPVLACFKARGISTALALAAVRVPGSSTKNIHRRAVLVWATRFYRSLPSPYHDHRTGKRRDATTLPNIRVPWRVRREGKREKGRDRPRERCLLAGSKAVWSSSLLASLPHRS
ncbi:uncharacterized protein TrAFT101_000521 [Trichoderma asperellum]|uniref:uncharacterized protein n=1 Tax=Trichoderma asperellum TaxID=101201 RepID=UPI00331E4634|nr:hypothetical protein TrAFT101_000521 [Trichoderma asperellum]